MTRRRFTLAEVLVAVMVIGLLVPIALRALMIDSRLDQQAAQRQEAAGLADFKLRALLVTGDWRDAESSGDFGDDYPGYTWELQTDDWTEGDITLRLLQLTVRGPGGADRTAVTLTTLAPESEEL